MLDTFKFRTDKITVKKIVCINITFIVILLTASSTKASTIGSIEKIQLAALLSFDYAAEMLGIQYGSDPTYPLLTANGVINDAGFNWAVTDAVYDGITLNWDASGDYNSDLDSINWTGGGSYDGHNWNMTGDVVWLSDTEFKVRHNYSIEGGLQAAYTGDESGTPGWDYGIAIDPVSFVSYEIKRSKTWFLGPRKKIDSVKVTVSGGVITENTLKIIDDKDKIGFTVKTLGGTIEIGGGEFHKTIKVEPIKVEPIPEPATILLFSFGLLGLAGVNRRN